MKIIITQTFEKWFFKEFKKYNFTLLNFINTLKKTKQICLKEPYFKIKINLDWVSLRWIFIKNDIWNIIPLFLILKKNKNIWSNLVLNKKVLEKIDILFEKMIKDFKKGNFNEY